MTAIAAKFSKDRKVIVLGSDSQTTWGETKYSKSETTEIKSKILKIESNYAVACSGKCVEIGLFQRYCQRTKPKAANEDAIFDFMVDFHKWVIDRDKDFKFCSQYIMAYKGHIFTIIYGWEVHEHKKYVTGGSGKQCVGVAFSMGADVQKAIEMAIKHDLYCGGDVNLIEVEAR